MSDDLLVKPKPSALRWEDIDLKAAHIHAWPSDAGNEAEAAPLLDSYLENARARAPCG